MLQNQKLGFKILVPESWHVYASESTMPAEAQQYARILRAAGAEMIFVAEHSSGHAFMRGIAEAANLEETAFFRRIEQANRRDLLTSRHDPVKLAGQPAVRWVYDSEADRIRLTFLEYQFRRGRYNVRISFWTHAGMFASKEKEFEAVMQSYSADSPQLESLLLQRGQ